MSTPSNGGNISTKEYENWMTTIENKLTDIMGYMQKVNKSACNIRNAVDANDARDLYLVFDELASASITVKNKVDEAKGKFHTRVKNKINDIRSLQGNIATEAEASLDQFRELAAKIDDVSLDVDETE